MNKMKKFLFIAIGLIVIIVAVVFFNNRVASKISLDVSFTDNPTFDEEQNKMDDLLGTLDDIIFLDMERDMEKSWYYIRKSGLILGDERFQFEASHLISPDSDVSYDMHITTTDFMGKSDDTEKEFTTSDDRHVFLEEKPNFKMAYFKEGNFYYTIRAYIKDDE